MSDLDLLLERLGRRNCLEEGGKNLDQEAAAAIRELQGANLLMRAKAETYDLALADKHAWEDTANYHKAEADALRADVEALRAAVNWVLKDMAYLAPENAASKMSLYAVKLDAAIDDARKP